MLVWSCSPKHTMTMTSPVEELRTMRFLSRPGVSGETADGGRGTASEHAPATGCGPGGDPIASPAGVVSGEAQCPPARLLPRTRGFLHGWHVRYHGFFSARPRRTRWAIAARSNW